MIKKMTGALLLMLATTGFLFAQKREKDKDKKKEEQPTFKENLFTGGSISVGFSNNTFLVGGSPVFGYSLTNWIDAGIVVNYTYTSYKDVYVFDDRLRQKVYGGGVFAKIYPVRFLFVQGQLEHNYIRQKYIPDPTSGAGNSKAKDEVSSVLVGGGISTSRYGRGGSAFYYISLLFDIAKELNSPYTDANGRVIPVVRAGLQIPLFQGGGGNRRR